MLKSFLHIDLFIKDFQYYSNIYIVIIIIRNMVKLLKEMLCSVRDIVYLWQEIV